jgi:anthranilate synthase component 2
MKIVLLDNYDSFTYNLLHYIGELGADVAIYRNDKITTSEVMALAPDAIVISPGPGTPQQSGICLELIKTASGKIPIFGVCLGQHVRAVARRDGRQDARVGIDPRARRHPLCPRR